MVTVLSAIFGHYDPPHPVSDGADRWIMVTDSPETAADAERQGWDPRLVVAGYHTSRVSAWHPKHQPHLYVDDGTVVWVDGGLTLKPGAISWASSHLRDGWLAMFAHPVRDCIYTEAAFSATRPKYDGDTLAEQVAEYRQHGHPERWGLWCGTFFAVRLCAAQAAFSEAWFTESARWGTNDQVSMAYTLRRFDARPTEFDGHLYDRRHFTLTDHG